MKRSVPIASVSTGIQGCIRSLCVLCVSAVIPVLPTSASAELVYTADGQPIYGQVRADAAGGVVIDTGDGAPVALKRDEVSAVESRPPPATSTPPTPRVILRNGDRLSGSLKQVWPPAVAREGAT